MSNGIPETEVIDKLFLELSQFTTARTGREIKLEGDLSEAVRLLKAGKRQFTPSTTNSEVDTFLSRIDSTTVAKEDYSSSS